MNLKVGTFNCNNLFSRFNFRLEAEVPDLPEGDVSITQIQRLVHGIDEAPVEYKGRALKHKDPKARQAVARRIIEMNLDILAVQEIEDIETLRYFAAQELGGGVRYPHLILIEGNDPRLIDVAVLSKYPLGAVVTWQHAVHPDVPNERVFSRDLLQVEVLNQTRDTRLLTLFNTHLKSRFVPFNQDQAEGTVAANLRRQQQAEMAARIIAQQMRPAGRFMVLGDMNDPVDSPFLQPLVAGERELVNGLQNPVETRPAPPHQSPPTTTAWTHRFKSSGQPPQYELFDHIWLSPSLAGRQTGAFIDRRSKWSGDGSDHDPAWVEIEL